jgi:hypothetical protein
VIGTGGRYFPAGKALDVIAGYVVLNDASARDWNAQRVLSPHPLVERSHRGDSDVRIRRLRGICRGQRRTQDQPLRPVVQGLLDGGRDRAGRRARSMQQQFRQFRQFRRGVRLDAHRR